MKIDQSDRNHGFAEMLEPSDHSEKEAIMVGFGNLVAFREALNSSEWSIIKTPGIL